MSCSIFSRSIGTYLMVGIFINRRVNDYIGNVVLLSSFYALFDIKLICPVYPILYRYAQYKGCDVSVGEDTNILSYTDAAQVAEYAIPAFQWAVGAGIINGTTASTLSPKGSATRGQVAAILHRYCEWIG